MGRAPGEQAKTVTGQKYDHKGLRGHDTGRQRANGSAPAEIRNRILPEYHVLTDQAAVSK